MLIRLLFFEKLHFPHWVDLRILFFLLFLLSRVRASSEVQTQTNCYMYAILLPVIRVTRWSNCGQCMCGDWWISILGFCQFTQSYTVGKGEPIRLNATDKNKEQVDFVHKPNQHWIIESRSNLTTGSFILWMDYWIDKPNHFSIHEFISPLAAGTLDMLWL